MVSTSNAFDALRSGDPPGAAPKNKKKLALRAEAHSGGAPHGAPPALAHGDEHGPRAPNAGGGARPEAPGPRADATVDAASLEAAASRASGDSLLQLLSSWTEKLVRGSLGVWGTSEIGARATGAVRRPPRQKLYCWRAAAAPLPAPLTPPTPRPAPPRPSAGLSAACERRF